MSIIYGFFGIIDWVIYSIIATMFRIIIEISKDKAQLFDPAQIEDIANKIYVVVGVFILFKLVISAIQYMVNPDVFDDKEKGLVGIIKNTVISIALIVVMPAIFNFAIKMQDPIIETLPKIILGQDDISTTEAEKLGTSVSTDILKAFISVKNDDDKNARNALKDLISIRDNVGKGCGLFNSNGCKYNYMFLISTLCGGFIAYVLLSMTLDVTIRTIKLSVIRMLAPIPISTYVYSKDKFNKFVKTSVHVYVDLFVRMAIVYFIVFAIKSVITSSIWVTSSGNWVRDLIIRVAIIIGLLMFAKNAPKFISELLGIPDIGSGEMADMFKPAWQRAGGAVGALANPGANAVANYRQARDMGRSKGEALRRAIGGFAKGALDSVEGVMAGDDWAKMKGRHEAAKKRSAQKIARIANYERDQQQSGNKIKRIDRALKALGFDRSRMNEYRQRANQAYDSELSNLDGEMQNIAHRMNTTADPTIRESLRKNYEKLSAQRQSMVSNRKEWEKQYAYTLAARDARDNTLNGLNNVITNGNNRLAQLDTEVAGGVTDERRAQIEMEKARIRNDIQKAIDERDKVNSANYVEKIAKDIQKQMDAIDEVEGSKISKYATTFNTIDTYFGGKGSRGKVYLDFADTLAKNRSSIYTGEAMTKMRQNADILIDAKTGDAVRHSTTFSNGQGSHPTFTYSEISDLLTRAKNGQISEEKLRTEWGFDNVAMVQSAFEDLEKQFAKDYVNANIATINGSVAGNVSVRLKDTSKVNSTITEWWDRFEDTIMSAGLPPEEARHYREEFLKNPGTFMANASDLKEKLTTRGTRYVDAEQPKDGK